MQSEMVAFFHIILLAIFSICLALINQINDGFTGLFPNFVLQLLQRIIRYKRKKYDRFLTIRQPYRNDNVLQ